MAAITFSDDAADAFTLRKAPFRLILTRTKARLSDPSDIEEIDVAEAMEGLAFDLMDDAQRERLLDAVVHGAETLRHQIAEGVPLEETVLPGIDDKLDELLLFLNGHRPATGG